MELSSPARPAAQVSNVLVALDEAGIEIANARSALEAALSDAEQEGYIVDRANGTIRSEKVVDEIRAVGESERMHGLITRIGDALKQAATADSGLSLALRDAAQGKTDGGDGTLADAVVQLPPSLDGLSDVRLRKELAGDIALDTITAYLEAKVELVSFNLEGKAKAEYKVLGDDSVLMSLTLEAGLGREIDLGGAELSGSVGLSSTLELKFGSRAEADAFLAGLDDAAFDLSLDDAGNVPSAVVENVANYIAEHNVTSFTTGVYGTAAAGIDVGDSKAGAELRADGKYDWVKKEFSAQTQVSVSADADGIGKGSVSLSRNLTYDTDLDPTGGSYSGKVSAEVANESFGGPGR